MEDYDVDTPQEVLDSANAAAFNLLPEKSKGIYKKTYDQFKSWCSSKNVSKITENVVLAFLGEKSKHIAPPTLWSTYSMLKATLSVNDNIDLKKFSKLVPYLKKKSVGYKPRKSKIFSKEDISNFIKRADDEDYLLMKVRTLVFV